MRLRPVNQVGTAAFTLVEVILAIGLVVTLLVVAMFFYRQATDMRGQILAESERCSTIRLVLDRMAADLRGAMPQSGLGHEFLGDTGTLSFVRTTLAAPRSGQAGADLTPGLVRVTFAAVIGNEGTNAAVRGFDRTEAPPGFIRPALSRLDSTNTTLAAITPPSAMTDSGVTNQVVEPLTDLIHYVRFRYWNGAVWAEGWTNSAPPAGVEIVLATDPAPDDLNADEYPLGAFRRVIFLPAGITTRKPEEAGEELLSTP